MKRGGNPQNLKTPTKGHTAGPGRPKNAVYEACRLEFEKRIPILCQIADDETAKHHHRIMAIEKLGEFGGLKKLDITSNDEKVGFEIIVTYATPTASDNPSETA